MVTFNQNWTVPSNFNSDTTGEDDDDLQYEEQ